MEASKQEAKASGAEEPSMEEILQSIKKIIAEDDPAAAAEKAPNGAAAPAEVSASDVLELTEIVEEPAAPAPASNDVLSKIDEALAVDNPIVAAIAPSIVTVAPPTPSTAESMQDALLSNQAALAATSAFKKLQTAAEPPLPEVNTTPSPAFASGNSVEGMVMNMLKPMMKDWLDKNLPAIVERIVTVEIRKLTK